MSAQEALSYGLIDEIVAPNEEKLRSLAMPLPATAPLDESSFHSYETTEDENAEYTFGKIVSGYCAC